MLFASTSLAARIERAECRLLADSAASAARRRPDASRLRDASRRRHRHVHGGGLAPQQGGGPRVRGRRSTRAPSPRSSGPSRRGACRCRRRSRASATPRSFACSRGRGYRLQGFENVLGRSLSPRPARAAPEGPRDRAEPGRGARAVERRRGDRLREPGRAGRALGRVLPARARGARDGRHGLGRGLLAIPRAPGRRRRGRAPACASSEGVAHLCGAATLPAHRRRGVQSALLAARLGVATEKGCDVAVVITQPGSKSQENVAAPGLPPALRAGHPRCARREGAVKVHLVDGTYELFRAYYGVPPAQDAAGRPVGAIRGILATHLSLLREPDVTHVACAFDHVIESFRNELFDGYKTGEGIDPDLLAQFHPAERAARALGIVVWPMVEFEADDALATGAARFATAPGVEQVVICSPDKDLSQCVVGTASSAATVASAPTATRPAWSRGSASRPRRSPTGSPSWATPPTGSPACRAGARSRRARCSPGSDGSRRSPTTPRPGTWPCAGGIAWPPRSASGARRRSSTGPSRRCATDVPLAERPRGPRVARCPPRRARGGLPRDRGRGPVAARVSLASRVTRILVIRSTRRNSRVAGAPLAAVGLVREGASGECAQTVATFSS